MVQWLFTIQRIYIYSIHEAASSTPDQTKKKSFLYPNCPAGHPLLPVGSQPLTEQVQRGRRLTLFGSQYLDGRILAYSLALRKPFDLTYDLLTQRIPLQFGSPAGPPPASPPLI